MVGGNDNLLKRCLGYEFLKEYIVWNYEKLIIIIKKFYLFFINVYWILWLGFIEGVVMYVLVKRMSLELDVCSLVL